MSAASFVLIKARIATMAEPSGYGLLDDGAIVVADGRIQFVGGRGDLPRQFAAWPHIDLGGRLVTPALIDCHTHLVHGGSRAREFEMRLEGASYAEIAAAGGGIMSTVRATRAAAADQLLAGALGRLDALLAEGTGTVEVKSGYGLDLENELKMLRVARDLARHRKVRIRTTFLGAHALPPEFAGRPDDFIDFLCHEVLPAAHAQGLVDAVDAFCEGIAFSVAQTRRMFEAATVLGLPVKIHAEQLSNLGGAALAAQFDGLSADHIEYLDEAGVAAMARAGTVATLLPGAFYCLRETQMPPIGRLKGAGVPIALSTDCNPGTSPLTSLLLTMNMGCTLFRLTPAEALAGVTVNAARALGLGDETGSIEVGKAADLAVFDVADPAELSYRIGFNPLHARFLEGVEA
ncbi:imidazolonepropionase [Zavarzinia compransoris]|uniref:imidazolonepropionase n=1 Tax=Zavarzinia marina TaxID=2911065 RepID=UPI001F38ADFD|nr:imidazolonepropionase [Zavarzinia marina]MCF4167327.1 imidazolonepropionase [Zavarzinia marina]